jgi:hypothetical protein
VTESEFVKTLFNAKTQAEEEYRDRPFDWKPVIYESQIDGMRELSGGMGGWGHIENWLRTEWDIIDDKPRREEVRASWAKIHEMLDEELYKRQNLYRIAPRGYGKTWLGSQIEQCWIDEHLRVPEVSEVSSLRNRGLSAGPFHLDKEGRLAYSGNGQAHWVPYPESDAIQLQEWLQLRSICRRTSSCGMA